MNIELASRDTRKDTPMIEKVGFLATPGDVSDFAPHAGHKPHSSRNFNSMKIFEMGIFAVGGRVNYLPARCDMC